MENNDLLHAKKGGIERLLGIMRRLRDPETGCPWDIEQNFNSIAPYTIEEAYEVADAIARGDMVDLKGELGDLLLQTVYHTAIGEEEGLFTFHSVADAISDKMVARHPHVFGAQFLMLHRYSPNRIQHAFRVDAMEMPRSLHRHLECKLVQLLSAEFLSDLAQQVLHSLEVLGTALLNHHRRELRDRQE